MENKDLEKLIKKIDELRIDVKNLDVSDPMNLEMELNNIPGVVENGIFAVNKPSEILVGK